MTIEQWNEADWTVLDPHSVEYQGVDDISLTVVDHDSVLVAPPTVTYGRNRYVLSAETQVSEVTALRLEALTHDSLPRRGPGRQSSGRFACWEFEAFAAHASDPKQESQLEFVSALTDEPRSRVCFESWEPPGGAPNVAVFELKQPIRSDAGLRLRLEFESHSVGRFRWSVTSTRNKRDSNADHCATLTKLLAKHDSDPWRQELRKELETENLAALARRTTQLEELASQPNSTLTWLAEHLTSIRDRDFAMSLEESCSWTTINNPASLETAHGTELTVLADGSIRATGPNPPSEQITIHASGQEKPVTAVRLELVNDLISKAQSPRWTRRFRVHLEEFSLAVTSDGEQFTPVPVRFALSDYYYPVDFSPALDGSTATNYRLSDKSVPHFLLFMLAPGSIESDEQLRIKLQTGFGQGNNLLRFRVSVTTDTVPFDHSQRLATSLLRQVVERDPSDYWAHVRLAETLGLQRPPQHDAALRHATAATAIRSNDVDGHVAMLRSLPVEQLLLNGSLRELLLTHVARVRELDPEHPAISELAGTLLAAAKRQIAEKRDDLALEIYRLVLRSHSDRAGTLHNVASRLSMDLTEYDLAIETFLRVIEIDPTLPWVYNNLGVAYSRQGDAERAKEMFRKEIEIQAEDAGVAFSNLAYHIAEHDLDEAIELCRRGIESTPDDARIHDRLGDLLLERGDLDDAAAAYRQAIEKDESDAGPLFGLATVLARQGQQEEAIKLRKQAIELSPKATPTQLNNLAWMLVTVEDETLRDPELALQLAQKAVEIDPKSDGLMNTVGVANYRAGNWQASIDALNKSLDTNTPLSSDGFFLAMAHWQLDEKDIAQEWFDKAKKWMDENDSDDAELIRFRAEAEALMGSQEDDDSPD